jgi:hypothetical protein
MDYREFRERYRYDAAKDLLGEGGFGRVFKARDVVLDRIVALKVFSRNVPDQYDLVSEIRKAISLNHPNICRYYGVEVLKGADALGDAQVIQVGIMDFIEGGTIEDFLRRNPQDRKKLLGDVLRGLSYLHRHQPPIIHRDLKPPNVLVSIEDGIPVAKIMDFGIAKTSRETGVKISRLIGTVAYMAPEQLNPAAYGVNGNIQCNLDLWSFGVMTMELLTGRLPFGAGDPRASTGQIQEAIVNGVSEKELNSFDEPYRSVLRKCMVQEAGKRAQSAAELIDLLGAAPHVAGKLHRQTVVEGPGKQSQAVAEGPKVTPTPIPVRPPHPPEPTPPLRLIPGRKWVRRAAISAGGVAVILAASHWLAPIIFYQACLENDVAVCEVAGWSYHWLGFSPAGFWEEAAYNGSGCADADAKQCSQLGQDYASGNTIAMDQSKAGALFAKACDEGSGETCYKLGDTYRLGTGVAPDEAEATAWYTKAASIFEKNCNNHVFFYESYCVYLGTMYTYGMGVPRDLAKAKDILKELKAACTDGDGLACVELKNLPRH